MRPRRHRPLPPDAYRDSPDALPRRRPAPDALPVDPVGVRLTVLRWTASEGYPDDVARAAEHALDLAVMRGWVAHWHRDDDAVTARAARVEPVLSALVPLLGHPR